MVRLSVNVNKVATVRNSRGGSVPSVLEAVRRLRRRRARPGSPCIRAPTRATSRAADVREIAAYLRVAATAASSSTSKAIRGPISSPSSTR